MINNQNEDIKIIYFPLSLKNMLIIIGAVVLVGIEFFILVRRKSPIKIQRDKVNQVESDNELEKGYEVKTNFNRDLTLFRK